MGIRQGRLRRRAVIGHPVVRAAPSGNPQAVVASGIRRRHDEPESPGRPVTDDAR
ncbi:hypothetical protein AAFP30_07050 [Gordonia sp. CPCC 205515]|uniref:hypothetical protein n=1 Tax=Gordonia sp. CPCC 205515 TaxID=3140791 RepID=UPI003AF3DD91